jgi:RNA polymerase sigma factor (sigma-70 family)
MSEMAGPGQSNIDAEAFRDDLALIRGVAGERDQEALKELIFKYAVELKKYSMRILGEHATREDVEDVVSDAFARVWLFASRYDSEKGSPLTWIRGICIKGALQRRRSLVRAMERRTALPEELRAESRGYREEYPYEAEYDREWVAENLDRRLARALDTLRAESPRDADLIVRRYLKNDRPIEIAADLGLSPGSVRVQLHRSIKRLHETMTREEARHAGRAANAEGAHPGRAAP